MTEEFTKDPIMQEALGHYFFADNAPAVAKALENLADNISATIRATQKLAAALAITDDPLCFPSRIKLRHRALLAAHQNTWLRTCDLRTLGILDPQVYSIVGAMWTKAMLNTIIDRCLRCASIQDHGSIRLVRLFGTMRPRLSSGPMLATDGNTSAIWNPCQNREVLAVLSDEEQAKLFPLSLAALNGCLASVADQRDEPRPVRPDGSTILYFFGPIDDYDVEVSLDAIRDFVSVSRKVTLPQQ